MPRGHFKVHAFHGLSLWYTRFARHHLAFHGPQFSGMDARNTCLEKPSMNRAAFASLVFQLAIETAIETDRTALRRDIDPFSRMLGQYPLSTLCVSVFTLLRSGRDRRSSITKRLREPTSVPIARDLGSTSVWILHGTCRTGRCGKRSHATSGAFSLSLSLSIYLPIYLSIYLSISLSTHGSMPGKLLFHRRTTNSFVCRRGLHGK